MQYQAPLNDIKFVLFDVLEGTKLQELEKYAEATPDLIAAVLEEGLPPIYRSGLGVAGRAGGFRRSGPAPHPQTYRRRDGLFGESVSWHVPGPDPRLYQRAVCARVARAATDLPGKTGQRGMDRHHVPDGTPVRH